MSNNISTAIVPISPTSSIVAKDPQATAWEQAYDAWLQAKRRKSGSEQTVRAYSSDFSQFAAYTGKAPWMVASRDVDEWIRHLQDQHLTPATINRKLAALSSFYDFVINKFLLIASDGSERSIYIDNYGNAKANPFRRPDRFKVDRLGRSSPMAAEVVRTVLQSFNTSHKIDSRDYALIVCYVYTGRRSSEIANLRWQDFEVDSVKGKFYYRWSGKAGTSRTDELPAPAWAAITNYLRVVGRLDSIQPGDFIFRPVYEDRALRLPNVHSCDVNHPLSCSMINRIVKRRFVAAGVAPEAIHTHTLRHTAASLRWRDGHGQDLLEISRFLNHSSVAVTQIYLSRMQKPVDAGWAAVEQLLS